MSKKNCKSNNATDISKPVMSDMLKKSASRRQVLKTVAMSGMTIASASTLLSSSKNAYAMTPKRGGDVRIGVRQGSVSDTFDPATFVNVFIRTMGYAMFNNLVEITGDGVLAPELFESWEVKEGATQWIFKIRQGVEFHNGKTLDADDIIASIQHHRGENSKSGMKAPLKSISEISKDGDKTLIFNLSEGNADFPFVFTDYRLMIMPSKDGKLDWESGVGTGGYVLDNFDAGLSAKLTRNPNYWRSDRAHFDSATILVMPDVASRQNALLTGEVDIIDEVELKTLSLLERRKDIKIADTKGALHYSYAMNTQLSPFDNNDVRLALKYGIDREKLLEVILKGYGSIGNDHPIAPIHQYFADDIEQRSYDPDKAKFHLNKAGLDQLTLDLNVSDGLYSNAVDGVTLYSEQLKPAGIDLKISREPTDGYFSNVWMKKPFVASYWGARPTEDLILSTVYLDGAPWNDTFLKNDKLDKLIVEARSELDAVKRGEMYRDIQIIIRDEGGTVIPLFANNVFAMSEKIAHPEKMSGAWELDGGRSIERWWFA